LTPTGYVAEMALAAARPGDDGGGATGSSVTAAELAAVQRGLFVARTAMNQVRVGAAADWATAVQRIDAVAAEMDRLLRRSVR
jgi:hypothetical protein